jgi:predicted N-acetyltransferase YhbS
MDTTGLRFETRRFDSALSPALAALIEDVFGIDVTPLDRLGGHDPSIVRFSWFDADRMVANVSLFDKRLVLDGRPVEAFAVQSVAVRPDYRGRGLFRDCMTRALAYADARRPLVLLATGTPELYRRFGFVDVPETSFRGRAAPDPACRALSRPLSLSEPADVAIIRDAYARRAPVSLVAGQYGMVELALLKVALEPELSFHHLPDLDAVVALEEADGPELRLMDIAAPAIPPLADIVAALGRPAGPVHVHVTPDRLAWAPAEVVPEDEGTMVRGDFPLHGRDFIFAPMEI